MRPYALTFLLLPALASSAPSRPVRIYDLLDVNWRVKLLPASYAIEGDVTNTIKPLADTAAIWFDCQKLSVDSVTANGEVVRFRVDGSTLNITLAKTARKGETVKVRIRYHGTPEAGVYFIDEAHAFPANTSVVYTQGEMEDTRNWLPTYDFPDDKATSAGILEVPKGWNTLSNGRMLKHETKADGEVFHWRQDLPTSTYLISFVAGQYSSIDTPGGSVPVTGFVPKGLEAWGQVAFGGTGENVAFYEKLTGTKYPWAKYSQSAVPDFMFGGMENVSATTQTITCLHPRSVDATQSARGLVAHELAHQWFGDLVTLQDWSHVWINEGWATFLPTFYTREKEGPAAYDIERLGTFGGALAAHRGAKRSMVWNEYQTPLDLFDGFAYPGGATRMFMLMHQVGEEKFWTATKKYLAEYRLKNVTTEQFFASFSKSLDIDLEQFRKQWFYTSAVPNLTLTKTDGKWVVKQAEPFFKVPLEFLTYVGGKAKVQTQEISGAETVLDTAADLVLLDPNVWLLAEFKSDVKYTPAQWRTLYSVMPSAGGKVRYMADVMNAQGPERQVSVVRSEASTKVLVRMIPFVTDLPLLTDLARRPEEIVRLAAVQRLGQLGPSDDSNAQLKKISARDENPAIQLAATRSYAQLSKDGSVAQKAWTTDSFDDGYRIFSLEYWRDHDKNRARTAGLQVLRGEVPWTEPLRRKAIEILGVLKDRPNEHVVYDALVAVLGEHTFGARTSALGALGEYGNKAAVPLIEPFTKHALSFMRAAAEGALNRLR